MEDRLPFCSIPDLTARKKRMAKCLVLEQFGLLTWKNLMLIKRNPFQKAILPLIITIAFPLLLRLLNSLGARSEVAPSVEPSIELTSNLLIPRPSNGTRVLGYAPSNNIRVQRIVERATSLMDSTFVEVLGFDDEGDLERKLEKSSSSILAGIVFLESSFNGSDFSSDISYKIRPAGHLETWFTNRAMPAKIENSGPRQKFNVGNIPGYFEKGFLTIQKAVDSGIIEELGGISSPMKTYLNKMAFPSYVLNIFSPVVYNILFLVTILGFLKISSDICIEVVSEKEKHLKEYMRILGLKNWINWSAWFIEYAAMTAICSVLMTVIYHVRAGDDVIFTHTSPTVTFLLIYLYSLATIVLSFAVSTMFSKSGSASFAVTIIYAVSIFIKLFSEDRKTSFSQIIILCAFPNLSLNMGFRIIINSERNVDGVQWNTLSQRCSCEEGLSMADVFGILLASVVLYGLITWYVDATHPGELGLPQPLYFPCLKRYWCGNKRSPENSSLFDEPIERGVKSSYFEKNSPDSKISIKIRSLTKTFGKNSRPAVRQLNMDICEGHIVALLGQNGAGKTTTMSMLTGLLPPSEGGALINGLNMREDMDIIRQHLGFCPQSNIMFDTLSVKEHLYFFARLKGIPKEEAKREAASMVVAMSLKDKQNTISKFLSGGMKRKLSLAIALVGGSKTVILDEPTSGLDPEARREIWDILKSHRHGRTMILSTHYMEEADYLGDKIAIMAEGVLQCYGSSMFLKKTYGVGYILTIVPDEVHDASGIENLIKRRVPDAIAINVTSAELNFHLPKESSPDFYMMFTDLETRRTSLGIKTFGLSTKSLETVFLKAGELVEYDEENEDKESYACMNTMYGINDMDLSDIRAIDITESVENVSIEGAALTTTRLLALLYKRILFSFRNITITIAQIMSPIIFTYIACIYYNSELNRPGLNTLPPFSLNLDNYECPITVYAAVTNDSLHSFDLLECFKKASKRVPGRHLYLNEEIFNYSTKEDMDSFFIKVGNENLRSYRRDYQIAVEIGPDFMRGFYNDESYHTTAIVLNLMDNAWLQCLSRPNNSSMTYTINTINHPLPETSSGPKSRNTLLDIVSGVSFASFIYYGLIILVCTFSVFLINERASGARMSQRISGAAAFTHWVATFTWDLVNYLVPCVAIVLIVVGCRVEGYSHGMIPGYMFLGLVLHGWSSIPLVYVLSFLFSKGSYGFSYILTYCLLTGVGSMIVVMFLQKEFFNIPSVAEPLEWLFYLLLPSFCLMKNFQLLLLNYKMGKLCSSSSNFQENVFSAPGTYGNKCYQSNYLSWNDLGTGKSLLFMAIQGFVHIAILLAVESDVMNYIRRKVILRRPSGLGKSSDSPDEDVQREKRSVLDLHREDLASGEHAVVLRLLTKRYGPDIVAVDNLCLKVDPGECFGLLGVNGAGKTSTFKMLVGEEIITSGEVYLKGIDATKHLAKTRKYVGYCPQFDSLIDELTVEEHLTLHARLRGVPGQRLKRYVECLMVRVMIDRCAKKAAKTLSGGNKRKLCIAISLVGRPKLEFLDEPTTGIDPKTRRGLWNLLSLIRQTGSTLILSSHSMEECEALCTRLAIMVNGQFKCLGSIQQLKSKFGSGYNVTLKLVQDQDNEMNLFVVAKAKDLVSSHFPGSILEYEGGGLLNYRIDKSIPGAELVNIFKFFEDSKEILQLDDYSVEQATLEQIFINFAMNQKQSILLKA